MRFTRLRLALALTTTTPKHNCCTNPGSKYRRVRGQHAKDPGFGLCQAELSMGFQPWGV